MISIEQIRAARGLLDWPQARLAQAAGISLPALANIERGATTPRAATLTAIEKALQTGGVEFTEANGLRRPQDFLKINQFEGPASLARLFDDFYETLVAEGGELLVTGIEERKFMKSGPEALLGFLRKINAHGKIRVRLLVRAGDRNFVGRPATSLYRWLPKEEFSLVPSYIYGDKHAVIIWGPPLRIIVTHNRDLAETYRRQFQAQWKRAQEPPKDSKYYWPYADT